jgi:hypothetical protein
VWCWGLNDSGQLGNGTTTGSKKPVQVKGLTQGAVAVTTGGAHSCAITSDGQVLCWGRNSYGQLGDGSTIRRTAPVAVQGLSAHAITAGTFHTCALTRTTRPVKCWGNNARGILGIGGAVLYDDYRNTPADVAGLDIDVVTLASGESHTCAVTLRGTIQCWGNNSYDQLGDGTTDSRGSPVTAKWVKSGVTGIATGQDHTCTLNDNGTITCWGGNRYGQLGDGSTFDRRAPESVVGLPGNSVRVLALASHSCAVTADRDVWCWGKNWRGQLGNGTTTDSNVPVRVIGLP